MSKTTEILDLIELFGKQFQFNIGESVFHRADTHKYDRDMGVLILERYLCETKVPSGIMYENVYLCRIMAWSNSGHQVLFKEHELMSAQDFAEKKLHDDEQMGEAKERAKFKSEMIYKEFNASKGQTIKLQGREGTFRVTGSFFGDLKGIDNNRRGIYVMAEEVGSTQEEINDPKQIQP